MSQRQSEKKSPPIDARLLELLDRVGLTDLSDRQKNVYIFWFGEGSSPSFALSNPGAETKVTSTSYIDRSSGPTNAKSFGAQSEAHNVGSVIPSNLENSSPAGELARLIDRLLSVLQSVQPADPQTFNATQSELNRVLIQSKEATPDYEQIRSSWKYCEKWIQGALFFGGFMADTALEVRSLSDRVRKIVEDVTEKET